MSSTMPVVWCTDPNSSEKRQPFALQGIQLQGNITEKHVLAMKELISAASEGRLLLPSDGAIVLLDCGLSIGSMVIEGKAGREAAAKASNHKSILPTVPEVTAADVSNCCSSKEVSLQQREDVDRTGDSAAEAIKVGEDAFLGEQAGDESKPPDHYGGGVAGGGAGSGEMENGEVLYEFLCCAKCMNDPASSCLNPPSHRSRSLNSLNNKSQLLSRFLNGRAKARLYCDPLYNISNRYFKRLANHHKGSKSRSDSRRNAVIRKSSIRSDRSAGGRVIKKSSENIPIYATVNKKMKLRSRLEALRRQHIDADTLALQIALDGQQMIKSRTNPTTTGLLPPSSSEIINQSSSASPTAIAPQSPGSGKPYNSSSRKTSFDSTCTVSSMDSGFIDQQQRQQLKQLQQQLQQQQQQQKRKNKPITVKSGLQSEDESPNQAEKPPAGNGGASDEDRLNELSQLQIKECLVTQSRNRRKSYEEFKSLFRQQQQQQTECRSRLSAVAEKDLPRSSPNSSNVSIKTRRKSYEEFKALVKICDSSVSNLKPTSEEEELEEDAQQRTTHSVSGLFKMKRKNSRRLSLKKLKMNDKAELTPSVPTVISNNVSTTGDDVGHVKSSTIYDILRNKGKQEERKDSTVTKELSKEEIYRKNYKIYDKLLSYGSKAYKKYDKYMTYGTIYEILHRKSDAAEDVFLRKRALSEKFAKRKHSVNSQYSSLKLGTIYDILQGKQSALESGTSDQSLTASSKEPEQTISNSNTLSTIYDIIHKKADSPKQQTKNRFLVKKITEEEFIKGNENNRNELNTSVPTTTTQATPNAPPSPDYMTPKPTDGTKKPVRARRFSNILSYSPRHTSEHPHDPPDSIKSPTNITRLKKIAASDEDLYKSATSKNASPHHHHRHHNLREQRHHHHPHHDDDLYSRIGKLRKSATDSSALCSKIDEGSALAEVPKDIRLRLIDRHDRSLLPQPGAIFKSNSLDMLAPSKFTRNPRWHKAQTGGGPIRKLSPLVMPRKSAGAGQQKKSTRRLSEFTRGEFLNEKP